MLLINVCDMKIAEVSIIWFDPFKTRKMTILDENDRVMTKGRNNFF